MKLIDNLMEERFKPFRKYYLSGMWSLEPCDNPYYFSSVVHGMNDVRLIKDELQLVIGLFEKDLPPTLIYPVVGSNHRDIERQLRHLTIEQIIKLA